MIGIFSSLTDCARRDLMTFKQFPYEKERLRGETFLSILNVCLGICSIIFSSLANTFSSATLNHWRNKFDNFFFLLRYVLCINVDRGVTVDWVFIIIIFFFLQFLSWSPTCEKKMLIKKEKKRKEERDAHRYTISLRCINGITHTYIFTSHIHLATPSLCIYLKLK